MALDTNELRRKVNSTDVVDHIDLHANIKPLLSELLDRLEVAEKERDAAIERLDKAKLALRQHHNLAMGEGFDPSHVMTKLRVSAYQQTNLFANTVAALEESK